MQAVWRELEAAIVGADVTSVERSASARADHAANLAGIRAKFHNDLAERQVDDDQEGYSDRYDALVEARQTAETKEEVSLAKRLGQAAVGWARTTTDANVTRLTDLAGVMDTHADNLKAAALRFHDAALPADKTQTPAVGEAQIDEWAELALAAEEKDAHDRIAGLTFFGRLTDAEMARVRLKRHDFHGDWNYEIHPHEKP